MLRIIEFEIDGSYIRLDEDSEFPEEFSFTIGDGDVDTDKSICFKRVQMQSILARFQEFVDLAMLA